MALVEFVLVVPIALALIFGIIAACYLFFQNSALHDGASAGARAASIETALVNPNGGQLCESGQPTPIEQTVARAAPSLAGEHGVPLRGHRPRPNSRSPPPTTAR